MRVTTTWNPRASLLGGRSHWEHRDIHIFFAFISAIHTNIKLWGGTDINLYLDPIILMVILFTGNGRGWYFCFACPLFRLHEEIPRFQQLHILYRFSLVHTEGIAKCNFEPVGCILYSSYRWCITCFILLRISGYFPKVVNWIFRNTNESKSLTNTTFNS